MPRDIEGTSDEVAAAIKHVNTFSGIPTVTLSDVHTLAELKTINNAISGTITLNNYTVALTGSTADVKAALAGTFAAAYTGNVTLTDNDTVDIQATDISTIAGDTTGNITVQNKIDIEGTPSEVDAAFDDVNTFSADPNADVTLTSDPNLAQLVTINNKIEGTITLQGTNNYSEPLSGSTANVKAALDGDFAAAYTGNVTLTDNDTVDIQATDISTIAGDTTGTITVQNAIDIEGTSDEIATAVGHVNTFSGTTTTVTLSDAHTLAELKTINNKISGTITLANYGVALSGSTADVKAALAGFRSSLHGTCNING